MRRFRCKLIDSAVNDPEAPLLRSSGRGGDDEVDTIRHQDSSHEASKLDQQVGDDVALTVVVRADSALTREEVLREVEVEVVQDAVTEAVQECVQEAVHGAVQEAVQQVLEESFHFDVKANLYTLIAVTGVILYWRGVWTLWDKLFGFSIWSEIGAITCGLAVMFGIRIAGVPLVQGLPGG